MEATNQEQRGESDADDTAAEPYHKPQTCDDMPYKIKSSSPCTLPPPGYSTQMQALQEEIFHLRSQVSLLQSQLASCVSRDEEQMLHNQLIAQSAAVQYGGNLFHHDDEEEEEGDEDDCEKSNHTSDDLCETADIFEITNMVNNEKRENTKELGGEVEEEGGDDEDFMKLNKAQCKRTNNVNLAATKGKWELILVKFGLTSVFLVDFARLFSLSLAQISPSIVLFPFFLFDRKSWFL
jgi:hypothetical protein